MTPTARLAAAASILDTLDPARPVEQQLKSWARANRYAGSKDRRAIADRVYTVLRRRRTCAAQGGGDTGRALVLGSLAIADGLIPAAIAELCTGGYGLAPLSKDERTSLDSAPSYPSDAARLDWPDWLWEEAQSAFGMDTERELDALRLRAPIDLRVNTLKATIEQASESIRESGFNPEQVGPLALRLDPGAPVFRMQAYLDGLVELQDAGSQIIAAATGAKPGEMVLDFCAGAGGKTLALAADMQNRGKLIAHDINSVRMAGLSDRAIRAGATCITQMPTHALHENCDRVLVDAPCSGSGSWRRDPAGKWALTAEKLNDLTTMQDDALDNAARHVRPGGTLTYATCSILRPENEARVAAFLTRHAGYSLLAEHRLHPARNACDGFYSAILQRDD